MEQMRERVELLPCPFCGDGFKIGQEPHDNHPVNGLWYLFHAYGELGSSARRCLIDVPKHFDTKEEAIAAWNTRAPTALQARVDVLEAALRECSRKSDEPTTIEMIAEQALEGKSNGE